MSADMSIPVTFTLIAVALVYLAWLVSGATGPAKPDIGVAANGFYKWSAVGVGRDWVSSSQL